MLEKLDMEAKSGRAAFRAERDALEIRLGALQRGAFQAGVPVVILFEGFDAAGKGNAISSLLRALDPRGFRVWVTKPRTEDEALRPFLWRFWNRIPARGRFAIFDGAWYMEPAEALAGGKPDRESVARRLADIRSFERQLADDGALVIKFFLHISKKEQKKRFERLSADPATAWRVTKEDRRRHRNYARYLAAAEELLKESDDPWAKWTPVAANDRRHTALTVLRTVAGALEGRLAAGAAAAGKAQIPREKASVLKSLNMKRSIARGEYDASLERKQKTLRRLEHRIFMERIPVVIVFEGWDAAGKGGCIKRLTRRLDPRGYEVAPFSAPTPEEKSRHYLWRFWREMPKAGHITIFDRSWYGRVLVERVEGFCSRDEWTRAYREIVEMEQSLADAGAVILKFWLHISQAEQLRRFRDREGTPDKRWKITEEDWRNRRRRREYESAVEDMVRLTGAPHAPWTIVEADSKLYARIKVLDATIAAIGRRLKERRA